MCADSAFESLKEFQEFGDVVPRDLPQLRDVHNIVGVNHYVSKSSPPPPVDLWMSISKLKGQALYGLAYNSQLAFNRRNDHPEFRIERAGIHILESLGNAHCSLPNVAQGSGILRRRHRRRVLNQECCVCGWG